MWPSECLRTQVLYYYIIHISVFTERKLGATIVSLGTFAQNAHGLYMIT